MVKPKYKPCSKRTHCRAGYPIILKIGKQNKLRSCRLVCKDAGNLGHYTVLLPAVFWLSQGTKKTESGRRGLFSEWQPTLKTTAEKVRPVSDLKALCHPCRWRDGEAFGFGGPDVRVSSCAGSNSKEQKCDAQLIILRMLE